MKIRDLTINIEFKFQEWNKIMRVLDNTRKTKLSVFCDADWASCPNTKRVVSGFLVKHGDSLISYKSKKQGVVSRILAEAEYRSGVDHNIVEVIGK
ncbi:hypothetical protein MTR67_025797 [Solanum verrucosum]|uniref:Uncharacterized protein n=1 Tax=Solanum verrucosum TaxID=315347 RepID=A0AAF0QXS6_SOLVR|nr:hypothetical protein MTR67_025797 [Solanum verrucosum]